MHGKSVIGELSKMNQKYLSNSVRIESKVTAFRTINSKFILLFYAIFIIYY